MPRDMIENERSTAITPVRRWTRRCRCRIASASGSASTIATSRPILAMIRGYCDAYGLEIGDEELAARAVEWAQTRGGRSGRVAIQFVRNLAGERGKSI